MRTPWLALVLLAAGAAAAADTETPEYMLKPRVAGIALKVPTLDHPFPANWQPTLFWWQAPLTFDDAAKLKEELQVLQDRGIVPCIDVAAEYADYRVYAATPERTAETVAAAKAVAAAGFPVHLAMKGTLDIYRMPGGKLGTLVCHDSNPDGDKKTAVGGTFCCLPLHDGWAPRADFLRGLFKQFADAGVPVTTVWYDYEGLPHPWNGYYEHSLECPGCKAAIPPEALATRAAFVTWVHKMRIRGQAEALARPVRDALPGTTVAFYGFKLSSLEHPVLLNIGLQLGQTPLNPPEFDFIQPVCYADRGCLLRFFNADWPVSQQAADGVYFATLLRTMSNNVHNKRPDQMIVPFVSSFTASRNQREVPQMSKPVYREFLRHALLRGARGFYVFNTFSRPTSAEQYYGDLANCNIVYNEVFAAPLREFFEGDAEVLNDAWHDPVDPIAVVWSGLAKGDRALIRIVSLAGFPRTVDIVPRAGGNAVNLVAPTAGAWYLVNRTGEATPLP